MPTIKTSARNISNEVWISAAGIHKTTNTALFVFEFMTSQEASETYPIS